MAMMDRGFTAHFFLYVMPHSLVERPLMFQRNIPLHARINERKLTFFYPQNGGTIFPETLVPIY